MRIRFLPLMFIVLSHFCLLAQEKSMVAHRISETVKIDGVLDEPFWEKNKSTNFFTVNYPNVGEASKHKTELGVFYDNQNLYVLAKLYDTQPDSVSYTLSSRDDFGNGDWFGVVIDAYQNSQNAFGFYSTASGVQIDEVKSNDSRDFNWNAVWRNKTSKFDGGYIVEMQIPFSALRFPKEKIQTWNINFVRQVRRMREASFWNEVSPKKFGELTQMGTLTGLENIKVPIRLSFTPYLAGSVTNYNDRNPDTKDWSYGYGGGVDVKYGLTESFTLDMTLIPDFSQVRSDNQVLNLTAFEVKFKERRPFFTEGTELFSIGDLFYSRRLGDRPFDFYSAYSDLNEEVGEQVLNNPTESRLLNATKLSGRTKKGLGIGFFNGIEARTYAQLADSNEVHTRRVLTNPLTNYNVLVFSQNLANASKLSFLNTNTWREGSARKSNVSYLGGEFRDVRQKFSIAPALGLSVISENGKVELGHKFNLTFQKISGNWRLNIAYNEDSDTYNPNDLGFLRQNNTRTVSAKVNYLTFKPKGKILRMNHEFNVVHRRLYRPNKMQLTWMQYRVFLTFKNFLTVSPKLNLQPVGGYDFFEPRVWGRFHKNATRLAVGGFLSSDYSKKFAFDADAEVAFFNQDKRVAFTGGFSPRVRVSDKLFFVYRFNYSYNPKQRGVVLKDGGVLYENDEIVYSKRDRQNITNEIQMEFRFTRNMGIDFRMRHYWATVFIQSYHLLNKTGELDPASYTGLDETGARLHDQNYNAFTIDFVYSWIFAPGSEINLTWKQSVYSSSAAFEDNYFRNTQEMFGSPMTNSISLKVLYYLDVLYFKKKNRKNAKKNRI